MTTFSDLASVPSDPLVPFTDQHSPKCSSCVLAWEGCRFGDGHGCQPCMVWPVGVVVMAWIASVC
jgi:hypothetical protein